jgi:hypothetical protein
MAECEVCGREYDELRFQIVLRKTAQGFDRVECAGRAAHALAAGDHGGLTTQAREVLERLEQTAAELFWARAELESERRRRRQLEEHSPDPQGDIDGRTNALASSRTR